MLLPAFRPRLVAVLIAPVMLGLAACAGPVTVGPSVSASALARETALQQQMIFERAMKDEARVYSLAFPLLGANAEYCDTYTRPVLGLSAWNIHSVSRTYQPAANSLYGLDERLIVKTIARKSPAQKAGLLSGDIIESINGQAVSGKTAARTFDSVVQDSNGQPVKVGIKRDGVAQTLTVAPITACNFPLRVDHESKAINAYADGKQIVITRGMIRFADNDEQLALVIAHELAHNALTHVSKLQQNAMAGSLGGLLVDGIFAAGGVSTNGQFAQLGANIGAGQNSVAFEQEADYVGMYFMERAGYSAANVAQFWRSMAAENANDVTQRTSHPTSPERFLAIEATYAEIRKKKATGQPLAPKFSR